MKPGAILPVIAALSCALAHAQIVYTPVIVPGQAAPGSIGTFNGPQPPAIQTPGRAAVFAFLINTPSPGFDNSGVWQSSGAATTLVAIANQPVAGSGGIVVGSISHPTQNRAGGVVAPASLATSGATNGVLLYSAGAGAQIAMREGDPAPGVPGGLLGDPGLQGVPDFAMNDSARLVFLSALTGVPAPGNRAMFAGDAATGAYSLVALNGSPSPTTTGAPFSFITAPAINGAGDVAFFSNLSAAPFFGLFLKPAAGPLQTVVAAGDAAPGFPAGWTITSLVGQNSGPPHFNNNGAFAVSGGAAAPGGFPSSVGLWRGSPGALQLIAKKGDVAPGHPQSAHFNDFQALINRNGGLLFYSNLDFGAQNAGIWTVFPGQAPRLLTLLNVQAPDMPPGTILMSISNGGIGFNNRAEGLVNASLNYVVNSTPANGIFAGRPGRLRKVVASGDPLEVSPGVFRTPISIFCWTWNSPDSGRQVSINDRGEVAFSCNFVGGGGATFIARLPHPCPGDATADDLVGFSDLNVVLAAFNTVLGNPAFNSDADFDQDDDVDFADINAVLSAFNSGC